jgi:hypothetical protein
VRLQLSHGSEIANSSQSIAAAAMLACIECSRYAEAIDAYDVFMSGNRSVASKYQWGGGDITAVKPLCRDLALSVYHVVYFAVSDRFKFREKFCYSGRYYPHSHAVSRKAAAPAVERTNERTNKRTNQRTNQ